MQEPQGHHFTGPEMGIGVFGHGAHRLIDVVEQRGDKLYGGNGLLRSWQGFTLLTSVEEVPGQCKAVNEHYWFA